VEAARAATADDVPTIAALARELRRELAELRGGPSWIGREAAAEPLDAWIAGLVARDDALVVAGTIAEATVGYGIVVTEELRDGRRLGVVPELYVERDARAVGVGEAIATALVDFCARAGCIGVDATALPGHRDAKNFFERNGFTARALTMHRSLLATRETSSRWP
jgi:GNAT superfamily N-acetyltransferase